MTQEEKAAIRAANEVIDSVTDYYAWEVKRLRTFAHAVFNTSSDPHLVKMAEQFIREGDEAPRD